MFILNVIINMVIEFIKYINGNICDYHITTSCKTFKSSLSSQNKKNKEQLKNNMEQTIKGIMNP